MSSEYKHDFEWLFYNKLYRFVYLWIYVKLLYVSLLFLGFI